MSRNIKPTKTTAKTTTKALATSVVTACLCFLLHSPAQAAENPLGNISQGMQTTATDTTLSNKGTIQHGIVDGDNRYGMYGTYGNLGTQNFINTGSIDISFDSGSSSVTIYGMNAEGGNSTLSNGGTITATATSTGTNFGSQTAVHGMNANGGNSTLSNGGTITATATVTTISSNSVAHANGMNANNGNNTFSNGGIITATATNIHSLAYAYGMRAEGGNSTLSNGGTIIATAISNGSAAITYGMYMSGSNNSASNTGIIRAEALGTTSSRQAFEVYGNHTYSVGTWATPLRTWSAPVGGGIADSVFGILDSNAINFTNATFILRPATAAQGFALGKSYAVKDMITVLNGSSQVVSTSAANVTGSIAAAVAEVPFLKASLTNGHDPFNATLRLDNNVSADTTPGSATAAAQLGMVHSQMGQVSKYIAQAGYELMQTPPSGSMVSGMSGGMAAGLSAGSGPVSNAWTVFVSPYGNTVSNGAYKFDGSSVGVTAGASYKVNEKLSLGAHFDFNTANYSADVLDMNSNSTSFALGLHAAYAIMPQWYVSAQMTGSLSQGHSDYAIHGLTQLSADSTYNGEALYLALNTGYVWQVAGDAQASHTLTPEVGISYLSTHTHAYDVAWGSVYSMYDMEYDATHFNALYGTINLDWRSEWQLSSDTGERSLALLAGLGLRQNLSGNDLESNMTAFGGASFTTTAHEDVSTWLADLGVEYRHGNFSMGLTYNGQYGVKQNSHGADVQVKLEF